MKRRKILGCLVFALFLSTVSSTASAEITGPTILTTDFGSTELLSWSWEATNSVNIGSVSGGGGAGKVKFDELQLTRLSDSMSAQFLTIISNGTSLPEVTLTRDNLTIVLRMVMISSYKIEGTSDKREPTTEEISLQFASVKFEIDGSAYCWDRTLNQSVPCN